MRTALTTAAIVFAAAVPGMAAEPLATSDGSQRAVTATPTPGSKGVRPPGETHTSAPDASPRPRVGDVAGRPPHGRLCFSQADTREKIVSHRLADPMRALRNSRLQGEALSAKLCRWKPDEFVYEIHVLQPDGRVLRVYVNAQNGEPLGASRTADRDRK